MKELRRTSSEEAVEDAMIQAIVHSSGAARYGVVVRKLGKKRLSLKE